MLKSLHIGRYVAQPEQFRALVKFLEAMGFDPVATGKGEQGNSTVLSAPLGLLSINALPSNYPPEVLKRLKDVAQLIVIEVSNPDSVFELAGKMKLKVLAHTTAASGKRSFSLQLPGNVIVTVHGTPGEAAAGGLEGKLSAAGKRFAIVVSRFNAFITERLLSGALDGLVRSGAKRKHIAVVRVPGAFEIPAAARTLAKTKSYSAIICLGCLLRGDTAHYDVIANEVARGIGQSAQETGVPHAFGVLTCDTLEQAIDRAGLKMGNKGFEAALAAIEMANLNKVIRRQSPAGGKKEVRSRESGVSRSARRPAKRNRQR